MCGTAIATAPIPGIWLTPSGSYYDKAVTGGGSLKANLSKGWMGEAQFVYGVNPKKSSKASAGNSRRRRSGRRAMSASAPISSPLHRWREPAGRFPAAAFRLDSVSGALGSVRKRRGNPGGYSVKSPIRTSAARDVGS
ncbi:MAG: hypothetical protein ABIW76_09780 [Fibrobacteria bacterium]